MYTIGYLEHPSWPDSLPSIMQPLQTAGWRFRAFPVRSHVLPNWQPDDTVQGWLVPLSWCPLELEAPWVITGLSARDEDIASRLTIPPGQTAEGLFRLAPNAEVQAAPGMTARAIRELRPDIRLRDSADYPAPQLWEWPFRPPAGDQTEQVALHVREFPPAPGAGVWAWVTPSGDTALRRALRPLHHPEVSRLTNLERDWAGRCLNAGVPAMGGHAREEATGRIDFWMAWIDQQAGTVQRAGLSASSPLGLVELAWEKTGLNFD